MDEAQDEKIVLMKMRLDLFLLEKFPHMSRNHVQSLIMQGKVIVDGKIVTKSGTPVTQECVIEVNISEEKFVSRAGYKLAAALEHFACDVRNATILDAGLSTGGFTDVLLQQGARKVYGVDVGYGQVHEKIRNDARVVVLERTNLRELQNLPELVDMVTLDLSFISVLKVMETVKRVLKPEGALMVLIKPQFEAERHQVGRGGIIKDPAVHASVLQKVIKGIEEKRFVCQGHMESPIFGTDGNKEFLAYFRLKL